MTALASDYIKLTTDAGVFVVRCEEPLPSKEQVEDADRFVIGAGGRNILGAIHCTDGLEIPVRVMCEHGDVDADISACAVVQPSKSVWDSVLSLFGQGKVPAHPPRPQLVAVKRLWHRGLQSDVWVIRYVQVTNRPPDGLSWADWTWRLDQFDLSAFEYYQTPHGLGSEVAHQIAHLAFAPERGTIQTLVLVPVLELDAVESIRSPETGLVSQWDAEVLLEREGFAAHHSIGASGRPRVRHDQFVLGMAFHEVHRQLMGYYSAAMSGVSSVKVLFPRSFDGAPYASGGWTSFFFMVTVRETGVVLEIEPRLYHVGRPQRGPRIQQTLVCTGLGEATGFYETHSQYQCVDVAGGEVESGDRRHKPCVLHSNRGG